VSIPFLVEIKPLDCFISKFVPIKVEFAGICRDFGRNDRWMFISALLRNVQSNSRSIQLTRCDGTSTREAAVFETAPKFDVKPNASLKLINDVNSETVRRGIE
jgi:hypothetical protein